MALDLIGPLALAIGAGAFIFGFRTSGAIKEIRSVLVGQDGTIARHDAEINNIKSSIKLSDELAEIKSLIICRQDEALPITRESAAHFSRVMGKAEQSRKMI